MSAEEWKTAVAFWGALTGTVGATLAILSVARDRSRIRVSVSEQTQAQTAAISDVLHKIRGDKSVFVEVVNVGRRVRYVYRAEIWVATADHLLVNEDADFIFANDSWSQPREAWQSWRLEEGQSVTFVFGIPDQYRVIRIDLPDSLARTRKKYARAISGRVRWRYGRWKGGSMWKEIRDIMLERKRTRHHDRD
jgi:hypothetical protein